jgi:hypothetical protein
VPQGAGQTALMWLPARLSPPAHWETVCVRGKTWTSLPLLANWESVCMHREPQAWLPRVAGREAGRPAPHRT